MQVPGRSKLPGGWVGAQKRPLGQGLGSRVKPPHARVGGRVANGDVAVLVFVPAAEVGWAVVGERKRRVRVVRWGLGRCIVPTG